VLQGKYLSDITIDEILENIHLTGKEASKKLGLGTYDSLVDLIAGPHGRRSPRIHVVSIECISDEHSEFCRAHEFQKGMSFLWDTVVAPKQPFDIEIQGKSQDRDGYIQNRYVQYI